MKKILIVDDNENNRYLLEELLKGYGYNAVSAKNGEEALLMARKDRPDLVISDLLMPVMDGFELCRQWKVDATLKKIPFIVYTATYTEPKDEKLVFDLGADRFVVKPQKPDEIIKIINEFSEFEDEIDRGLYKVKKPLGDEMEVLRQYNGVLFSKLEHKVTLLKEEILARGEAEGKLMHTVEALESSNAELEKFLFAASHDMQEPLRMVSNYVGLLKKRYADKLDKQADEYIDYAVQGVSRMSDLIKGIIDYSKIGRIEKQFEPVNLNDVVEEAMNILDWQIKEKKAVVSKSKMPMIAGDRGQLVHLFQNLVGNSLKFAKKDEAPVIDISAARKINEWEFCVRDNGIGIEPRYFNKIFIIFEQLHNKEEYEGTGIGLALCKKIVEYHGGRIWVESEEGKGAAFYFVLPGIKAI